MNANHFNYLMLHFSFNCILAAQIQKTLCFVKVRICCAGSLSIARAVFCLFDIFCLFSAPLMLWLGKQAFRKPTALANGQKERNTTPGSSQFSMHWVEHVTDLMQRCRAHFTSCCRRCTSHWRGQRFPFLLSFLFCSHTHRTRTASFKAIICFCPFKTNIPLERVNKIEHRLRYCMKEACWVPSPTLNPFYREPSSINSMRLSLEIAKIDKHRLKQTTISLNLNQVHNRRF